MVCGFDVAKRKSATAAQCLPSDPEKLGIFYVKIYMEIFVAFFMFAQCISSIKNTFIISTDAHYYKITEC